MLIDILISRDFKYLVGIIRLVDKLENNNTCFSKTDLNQIYLLVMIIFSHFYGTASTLQISPKIKRIAIITNPIYLNTI